MVLTIFATLFDQVPNNDLFTIDLNICHLLNTLLFYCFLRTRHMVYRYSTYCITILLQFECR